jgi:hypothetical protein
MEFFWGLVMEPTISMPGKSSTLQ